MLKELTIRNARPKDKPMKLSDGKGLFLLVHPNGSKYWRLDYRFGEKRQTLALGVFPDVSLKEARAKREEARKMLGDGINPADVRRTAKTRQKETASNTFEAIGIEWIARHLADKAPGHRNKVVRRLERDIFPYIGRRPVTELTAPEILGVVRRIETRGALETAHRALQNIGQILRYAVATGHAVVDITSSLRGALPPSQPRHMAAPEIPEAAGSILRAMDAFKGGPIVSAAMRLLPLLFCRPGELRTMRWEDVDLDAAEWRYTASKTEAKHLVPLSRQALDILRDLKLLTGHLPGGWVFPGGRSPLRPMSDAAINAAYRRIGIDTKEELTGHGWRAVARTLLHERLGFKPEIIEHQLAHAVPDTLGKAYNRTKFADERRRMMQTWADYLDRLKSGEVAEKPIGNASFGTHKATPDVRNP